MLLLPAMKWLKSKGLGNVPATLLSMMLLVAFFALVVFFISWQVSDLAGNATKIQDQLSGKYQQLQEMISQKMGIPPEKQQEMIKKQQSSSSGKMTSIVTGFLSGFGSFLTNTILVLVYIFLFIHFRARLKGFIVRLVSKEEEAKAVKIVDDSSKVAQKYLTGMFLMIVCLWVMYGIGFSIVGVKNAIFFAILCGLLEIVPFVGNLFGTLLTITISLAQGGGGMSIVLGILITYAIVQFIQTYLLEPLVVGAEVSLNPLFTIVGLIAGETLWGIAGMVLAIPLLGMAKIVCDNIEPLKPYGYLIGQDKKDEETGFKKKLEEFGGKIKSWFK
jgi:predicted PurR-regulated permease PerM